MPYGDVTTSIQLLLQINTLLRKEMTDEGPSEKKVKMSDRVIIDSPLAPPAIGDIN